MWIHKENQTWIETRLKVHISNRRMKLDHQTPRIYRIKTIISSVKIHFFVFYLRAMNPKFTDKLVEKMCNKLQFWIKAKVESERASPGQVKIRKNTAQFR